MQRAASSLPMFRTLGLGAESASGIGRGTTPDPSVAKGGCGNPGNTGYPEDTEDVAGQFRLGVWTIACHYRAEQSPAATPAPRRPWTLTTSVIVACIEN